MVPAGDIDDAGVGIAATTSEPRVAWQNRGCRTMVYQIDPDAHRTVRVLVLANVRLYREGLAHFLKGHDALTVIGAGAVDAASVEAIRIEQPDVVLLDANTVCETNIVRDLARVAPRTNFVAYGVTDEGSQALRCAEAGVSAFVPGEASGDELVRVIAGLRRGEFSCSPRVSALLMKRVRALSQHVVPASPPSRLTAREQGIVAFIAEGLSNKEIATRLGIELSTVKNHVHHILEKLQVTRRSQAAARIRHQATHGSRSPDLR